MKQVYDLRYYLIHYYNLFQKNADEDEIVSSLIEIDDDAIKEIVLLANLNNFKTNVSICVIIESIKNAGERKALIKDKKILAKMDSMDLEILLIDNYSANELAHMFKNKKFIKNISQVTLIGVFSKLPFECQLKLLLDQDFLDNIDVVYELLSSLDNLDNSLELFKLSKIMSRINGEELSSLFLLMNNENVVKVLIDNPNLISKLEAIKFVDILTDINLIDKLFASNKLPLCKAIFIIKELEIDNEEKLMVLQKYYSINANDFKQVYEQNLDYLMENIFLLRKTNDLHCVVEDLKNNEKLQKSIMPLLQKFFKKLSSESSISMVLCEVIFSTLTIYLSKSLGLEVNVYFTNQGSQYGEYNDNIINLNRSKLLDKSQSSYVDMINTILHELVHSLQDKNLDSGEINYDNLKRAKDLILQRELDNYLQSSNEHNYIHNSLETDASCRAYVYTIRLLKKINPNLAKEYMEAAITQYKKDSLLRNSIIRIDENQKEYFLEEYFNQKIDRETILCYLKKYPILSMEYNSNGTKKSIVEMFNHFAFTKRIIETLKRNSEEYTHYLNIYLFGVSIDI